jgi:SAM-dependent methyltransferase
MLRLRTVNAIHDVICSSAWWDRRVKDELLPWGLNDVELGDDVLEIGPGFGATTRRLAASIRRLTALELDVRYCERLRRDLGGAVDVVQGDATQLPFEADRFSAVVCFTMLHHIPAVEAQDRVFSEVARVLRPGGTFAGTDSIGTGALFKLIHVGDILRPIDPDSMPARLSHAGLADATISRGGRSFRFRATKPAP